MCLLPVPPALLFTLLSDKKITLFSSGVKWDIYISDITFANTAPDALNCVSDRLQLLASAHRGAYELKVES
jgi:hypothetical protein